MIQIAAMGNHEPMLTGGGIDPAPSASAGWGLPAPAAGGRTLSKDALDAASRRHRLEIHVDRVGEVLVVAPVGDLDIVTGGLFLETMIAAVSAGEVRLIVDLRAVPFMDSTGLAIFLTTDRALRSTGGQLRVVAHQHIAEMFEFAWMDKFFPLHHDLDDAVRGFGLSG
jgi:anti-sigma B factor antagonist